jgi:hypothetical protein
MFYIFRPPYFKIETKEAQRDNLSNEIKIRAGKNVIWNSKFNL